jgi:bisphosphoglycerate-dependent phosphoglycerate mutase
MKRIPIKAAQEVAEKYGYDQVMIYARKVGDAPDPHGEHMTTYGVNKAHCDAMARIGSFLQTKIMGWVKENK